MMNDDEIMSVVVDYSVSTGMDPLDLMSNINDSYSSFEDLSVDLDMTKGKWTTRMTFLTIIIKGH